MSPSTASVPQSTGMHRQQPQEGRDARYPLSLATFLPCLCFLGCVTAPRLVFCIAQGSRRAGSVQAVSCCLELCVTRGLSCGEKQSNVLVVEFAVIVVLPCPCPRQSTSGAMGRSGPLDCTKKHQRPCAWCGAGPEGPSSAVAVSLLLPGWSVPRPSSVGAEAGVGWAALEQQRFTPWK